MSTSISGTPAGGRQAAATILYQDKVTAVERAQTAGEQLWLTTDDLTAAAGWELEPQGICREGLCIPLPADPSRLIREGGNETQVNLAEFARLIEQPVAHDETHNVWYFGPPAWEWKSRLGSRLAPDFTLPDFQGKLHSLSDYGGKKIFLLAWASW